MTERLTLEEWSGDVALDLVMLFEERMPAVPHDNDGRSYVALLAGAAFAAHVMARVISLHPRFDSARETITRELWSVFEEIAQARAQNLVPLYAPDARASRQERSKGGGLRVTRKRPAKAKRRTRTARPRPR